MILDDAVLLRLIGVIENGFAYGDDYLKVVYEHPSYLILREDPTLRRFLKEFLKVKKHILRHPDQEPQTELLTQLYKQYEMYRRLIAFDNKELVRFI